MTNTTSPAAELAHLAAEHPAALWAVCGAFTRPGRRVAVADAILAGLAAVPVSGLDAEATWAAWGQAVAQVAQVTMADAEVAELVGLAWAELGADPADALAA